MNGDTVIEITSHIRVGDYQSVKIFASIYYNSETIVRFTFVRCYLLVERILVLSRVYETFRTSVPERIRLATFVEWNNCKLRDFYKTPSAISRYFFRLVAIN